MSKRKTTETCDGSCSMCMDGPLSCGRPRQKVKKRKPEGTYVQWVESQPELTVITKAELRALKRAVKAARAWDASFDENGMSSPHRVADLRRAVRALAALEGKKR